MVDPSYDTLSKLVDSRYTLVVAAAKRARQITEGMPKLVDAKSDKPVSIALLEIATGRVQYERTKAGIK